GIASGREGRRGRGAPRGLPRGRVRVAERGLLDVPRDERGQAPGPRGLRLVVEPQLHRAAGEPDRPGAPDEPGHGRGRRGGRGGRRRAGAPAMKAGDGRREIAGRAIPLAGNDMDTDRIIPARYLKSVTFEGLEANVFGDARKQDPEHPFNQKAYEGASILVV